MQNEMNLNQDEAQREFYQPPMKSGYCAHEIIIAQTGKTNTQFCVAYYQNTNRDLADLS
jgi:hypothetical protein